MITENQASLSFYPLGNGCLKQQPSTLLLELRCSLTFNFWWNMPVSPSPAQSLTLPHYTATHHLHAGNSESAFQVVGPRNVPKNGDAPRSPWKSTGGLVSSRNSLSATCPGGGSKPELDLRTGFLDPVLHDAILERLQVRSRELRESNERPRKRARV